MAKMSVRRTLREIHGPDVEVTVIGRSGRAPSYRYVGRHSQTEPNEPQVKQHPYVAFIDGLAKLALFIVIGGVLLALMAALAALLGLIIWLFCSIFLNMQNWACWAVTLSIEAGVLSYALLRRG